MGIRMKSFLLLFLIIFSITVIWPQNSKKNTLPKLQDLMSVLEIASLNRTLWDLAINYPDEKYKTKSNKDVISDLKKRLEIQSLQNDSLGKLVEYQLFKKYNTNVLNMFAELGLIGEELGMFIYVDNSMPVNFALKDNHLTFLLMGVASENSFNTLRLTAKERAVKIIESMILPTINKIYKSFNETEIKYIGMAVTYGSKDFSDESSVLNQKPETVILVVSMEKCKDYIAGKITQEELVNASDIFQSSRDMIEGVKKIKVTIE